MDNDSLPTRGVGKLPGPLSDQHGFGRRGIPTDSVFEHCITIQARDEVSSLAVSTHEQVTLLKECRYFQVSP